MSDERQAYTAGDAIYTKTGKRRAMARQNNGRTQALIGKLLIGGGMIWAAYVFRTDYTALWQPGLHVPGPLEIFAIGILVWLHARWRRSIQPK